MKVLIIGSNGQIGWELARQVIHTKLKFVALNRQQLDITDRSAVQKALHQHNPGIIIKKTAYTAVDRAESEPETAFGVNYYGVGNLADICAANSIVLIHISTDYVFDGSKIGSYVEDDPVKPLGIYGQSKLKGEEEVRRLVDRHIILRTSWVFGVHGHNFVKAIINKAKENKTLSIVNDQFGGPTPAGLVASVILKICEKVEGENVIWGTYHLSGLPHTTWYEFAKEVIKSAKQSQILQPDILVKPVSTSHYKTIVRRPVNSRLSNEKIRAAFQIENFSYTSSIERVIYHLTK